MSNYLKSCAVSGFADIAENHCLLGVRANDALAHYATGSQNEWPFRIVSRLGADVLDTPSPFRSEKVEA